MFGWCKRFRDGKEGVEDEARSGRPTTITVPDNIERVRQMLADDRRLSLRMTAGELKISTYSEIQKRMNTLIQAIPQEASVGNF